MRLPERPQTLTGLDLMIRLKEYADGLKSWFPDRVLGSHERAACHQLYSNLTALVERCLHPMMDRVTSREMEVFTMHDHGHGLKVAHLMWHIIQPRRRDTLSPGEIALLVVSAHLHDLGMGLSKEERETRLRPESDLWD
jgi:molecular chaperone HtpG